MSQFWSIVGFQTLNWIVQGKEPQKQFQVLDLTKLLWNRSRTPQNQIYWDFKEMKIKFMVGPAELKKVLTFRIANLPDYIRKASQTFRITIGLLSFFKTFRVALLPRYPCFCDSAIHLYPSAQRKYDLSYTINAEGRYSYQTYSWDTLKS